MSGGVTTVTKEQPYLVEDRDRHGNVRRYVRLPRRKKIRIKEKPGTPEFAAAYAAAVALQCQPIEEHAQGSLSWLCERYYASKVFKALDESTQSWRRRYLGGICATKGALPFALMEAKHVRKLRDELADKPVVANMRMKALKALFKWACDAGDADRNPAREVDLLKTVTNGHRAWTIEEVEAYEDRHPIGTMARLAMALMLYTAGRREDAVRLGRQHIRNKRIQFTQAKNEHRNPIRIDVPLHPDLEAVIAGTDVGDRLTFLVTSFGKPFSHKGFGAWFADRCDEAGVSARSHGLRKALCVRLAENGATPHEIMAWTGHLTLEEVEVYTREVETRKNADAALRKWRAAD